MTVRPMRPMNEAHLTEGTTSIATSPVAAQVCVCTAGYISRVMQAAAGTFTGTITTTVAINGGSDVTSAGFLLAPQTGANAGVTYEFTLPGAGTTDGLFVNEGDIIVFTPSGGTGASIGGAFTAVIRTI